MPERTANPASDHPAWCDPRICEVFPGNLLHAGPVIDDWKPSQDGVMAGLALARYDELLPDGGQDCSATTVRLKLESLAYVCSCQFGDGRTIPVAVDADLSAGECVRLARELLVAAERLTTVQHRGDAR